MGTVIKPIFVGIAGGSASGKSSIAKILSSRLGADCPIISQDCYYNSVDARTAPTHNWDDPKSFDTAGIITAIRGWKLGIGQWVPRHDYATYTKVEFATYVQPAPIMIFEGLHAFRDPMLASLIDCKIFIDSDLDVALGRRLLRDVKERGHTVDATLTRYLTQVKPAYTEWVLPLKRRADIVVHNDGKPLDDLKVIDIIGAFLATL